MNKENDSIFARLPDDVIGLIFSFDTTFKWRKGKWMNQILEKDPRKEILKKIPKSVFIPPLLDDSMIENVHYHNYGKWDRLYVSIKKGKKEMIHYTYSTDQGDFYYEYIYISSGRLIGYAHKECYCICFITDDRGFSYNHYLLIKKE
jgi:hypothetical protein